MGKYPRIKTVKPLDNQILIITFKNNVEKKYNCSKMIKKHEIFKTLLNKAFFKNVYVDSGGYGICWNSDLDISEAELWENGENLTQPDPGAT